MKHLHDIQSENPVSTVRYCPYQSSLEWQAECMGTRCMKFDVATNACKRN